MSVKSVVVTLVVVFGLLVGVSVLMWNFGSGDGGESVVFESVDGDSRNVKGEGDNVIVEFSDFQCPACSSVVPVVNGLLEKYKGRVKYAYRHFPLKTAHKNAEDAAVASEAAGEQGRFWEYHDLLFERQSEWSGADDVSELFERYAGDSGLDVERFKSDYERRDLRDRIGVDILDGNSASVVGTPSFFLNGEMIDLGEIDGKLSKLVE